LIILLKLSSLLFYVFVDFINNLSEDMKSISIDAIVKKMTIAKIIIGESCYLYD